MTKMNRMDTFLRAAVALATSVVTGATAGALLARKPLVVRVGSDGRRHVGELR
jgi:hypothetical protein